MNCKVFTNSFPAVGKKPSSPSFGIRLSLGLMPSNHGDANLQCLCLQKKKQQKIV